MGLVHLAEHRTSKDKVAMKQIDLEESQDILDLIIVEIEVMKGMNHPNLVNFKQVIMLFLLFNQTLSGFCGRRGTFHSHWIAHKILIPKLTLLSILREKLNKLQHKT